MTFTSFDIALPICLGAMFGVVRYVQYLKSDPGNAVQLGAKDALMGIAGMGVMTVVLKYLHMI